MPCQCSFEKYKNPPLYGSQIAPLPFSLVWYTGLWIDRFGSVMTAMTFVLRINSWIVEPKIFQSGIVWFLSIEICWDVFCSNAYPLEPINYHGHFSFIVSIKWSGSFADNTYQNRLKKRLFPITRYTVDFINFTLQHLMWIAINSSIGITCVNMMR